MSGLERRASAQTQGRATTTAVRHLFSGLATESAAARLRWAARIVPEVARRRAGFALAETEDSALRTTALTALADNCAAGLLTLWRIDAGRLSALGEAPFTLLAQGVEDGEADGRRYLLLAPRSDCADRHHQAADFLRQGMRRLGYTIRVDARSVDDGGAGDKASADDARDKLEWRILWGAHALAARSRLRCNWRPGRDVTLDLDTRSLAPQRPGRAIARY